MSYSFKKYFLMLANYNAWANQRLFFVLKDLNEDQINQNCGAYFESLFRTVNHILVADILWFERIHGVVQSQYALDEIVHADLDSLTNARFLKDQSMIAFVQQLNDEAFHGTISYTRHGQRHTEPLIEVLAHVFNHQIHHRGQLHSMIFQITGVSLALDLIYFQREQADLYR
ncbi:DinB family protein [Acinetobacter junii]|uniref:DinB family protein n=1 Tax=Acinetobacter junii TaxID=40215 RepID=UPI003A89BB36